MIVRSYRPRPIQVQASRLTACRSRWGRTLSQVRESVANHLVVCEAFRVAENESWKKRLKAGLDSWARANAKIKDAPRRGDS